MQFLVALAASLMKWIIEKAVIYFLALTKKLNRRKQVQEDAQASVRPLKDAITGEQIDAATDDALDKL